MSPVIIPLHLFIPAILSLLILIRVFAKRKAMFRKRNGKANWITLMLFFTLYGLIVGVATYDDINYQSQLNSFDLNKDGFFGGDEITIEQEEAVSNLTHDTGRNFSVFTGFIFAALVALPIYITIKQALKKKPDHRLS
ncbi:hypothetical protein [Hymenobacter sediminicola]|uniref:Uncharacterized protein n=1 Tax=Hymenobacter sediminicola TaxID=2761579 RepID=A0A7G7W5L0_9BACT|nr:hypothetical protein [Hymenobacter sediminicola]QNH61653.1 hypothetical protein H4317_16055 [Hymenobacter sediminicola]